MISHVTYVSYIALLSTHAALQLNQPQSPCSCAAEIFHFWLIRIHSNARNSIIYRFHLNGHTSGDFTDQQTQKLEPPCIIKDSTAQQLSFEWLHYIVLSIHSDLFKDQFSVKVLRLSRR